MLRFAFALAATAMIATPALAANQCRDAHGKFVKCPEKAAPAKKAQCRDAKGKFIKCK